MLRVSDAKKKKRRSQRQGPSALVMIWEVAKMGTGACLGVLPHPGECCPALWAAPRRSAAMASARKAAGGRASYSMVVLCLALSQR